MAIACFEFPQNIWEVMTYKEIIKALEDLGEVFVKVTAHKIDKLDDGNLAFNADKKGGVCSGPGQDKYQTQEGQDLLFMFHLFALFQ